MITTEIGNSTILVGNQSQSQALGAKSPSVRRSVEVVLAPLERLASESEWLKSQKLGVGEAGSHEPELVRYVLRGPLEAEPIRIGIFAGIHGDEPEGVRALVHFVTIVEPLIEMLRGYELFIYPICNPTGFEANSRNSANGKDLNREFWRNSGEREVQLLESELRSTAFDGLISLHSDHSSTGFYGFARGATITTHLMRPALAAAAELLPVNRASEIDGFHASEGIIRDCYDGVLSAPPKSRSKPFDVILETPGHAPLYLREYALVLALRAILAEYRKFIAYAPNL
jgi:protein MpaA